MSLWRNLYILKRILYLLTFKLIKIEMYFSFETKLAFQCFLFRNTCSVLCCGKTLPSSSAHNISYLPYPADPALVIKWWAATGRKPTNDFDSTGYKICSLHFTNQDWVVDRDSQRILKATAVPSKNVAKLEQNICSLAVCRLCLAESDVIGDLFTENSVSKYLLKMLGRVLQTEVVIQLI